MKNIQELRIGNWVKTCTPNMPIMIPELHAQIQAINLFKTLEFFHSPTTNEGFSIPLRHVAGIEITPARLKHEGFFCRDSGEITQWFPPNENNFYIVQTDNIFHLDGFNYPIKYFHNLQNLYFDCCGIELNFTAKHIQKSIDDIIK